VPAVFVCFGLVYLVLTLCNDVAAYRHAIAAGQPALLTARSVSGWFERNTHLLLLPKQQAANLSRDTTPDRI